MRQTTASLSLIMASLLAASTAHAVATLQISGPNTIGVSNLYEISLTTEAEGVSSLQFDLVTATGTGQLGAVTAPAIPRSDPTCNAAPLSDCNMSGANPVINPANPNGLNGFGLFTTNTPPLGPATYPNLAFALFTFAGADQISFANVFGFDASGSPLAIAATPVLNIVPEPTTACLLGLGLLGLGVVGRRG